MNAKNRASKTAQKTTLGVKPTRSLSLAVGVLVVLAWGSIAAAISSRVHLVMGYTTLAAPPTWLEPLLSSNRGFLFVFCGATLWLALLYAAMNRAPMAEIRTAILIMAIAALPLVMQIARILSNNGLPPALYWEPLWLAAWTGASCSKLWLIQHRVSPMARVSDSKNAPGEPDASGRGSAKYSLTLAAFLSLATAIWWYCQSAWYQEHFLLGFNDFGHFTQRIANSGAGRGFLLETPVLPPFWDHFNPGLLLLVPIWILLPSVYTVFTIQAVCLAGSSLLIWGIARKLAFDRLSCLLWSAAWLAQPALGQMNLAYTYGWHPVSLAIPALLATVLSLLSGRRTWAFAMTILACSMEEGIMVVVGLFSAVACLHCYRLHRQRGALAKADVQFLNMSMVAWLASAVVSAICFVAVYRFSGLADFQTGRFISLGSTPQEILLSPFQRPQAFWGELLKPSKLAFLLSLLLPCYLPALNRGRFWLMAAVIPLSVLVVWDHQPAACLGFQYASGLLPIFWFAALWGSRGCSSSHLAMGSLTTGLVLSLFVGQLPYSSSSIEDVISSTYGSQWTYSRAPNTEVGHWLKAQIDGVRADGAEVLATGRIAAHLVGNRDVETVGQYLQRRQQLAELPDRLGNPIGHYVWVILDRSECFQQSIEDTQAVEAEALQNGFEPFSRMEEIVVLRRLIPNHGQ